MQLNKDQQVRVMIYAALVLMLAVGGFLFFLVWQDNQDIPSEAIEGNDNLVSQRTIDKSVLESTKFQELSPVKVVDLTSPTSTPGQPTDSGRLTEEQLSRIPRRNSNPFIVY